MIRVLLYEDNRNYREALEDALSYSQEVCLAKSFDNANRVITQVNDYQPDVVLMDIEMPGASGLDALEQINRSDSNAKVLIQTQFNDEHRIFVALCRGAWGYALKSDPFDRLEGAIKDVYSGGGYFSPSIAGKVTRFFMNNTFKAKPDYTPLTNREQEVLQHLVQALRYKEIAEKMYLSYEGVHSHIKSIYKKLHVSSRSEATLKAIENKLI